MPFETEAYVLAEKDAPFVLETIQLDDPLDNEVLIEVVACGLCHTDLCIQNGLFPSTFPCTTGHEGSGIVKKVGSGVTKVKEGDSVLMSFAYCGKCKTCQKGHPAGCSSWLGLNFGRLRSNGQAENASSKTHPKISGHFFGQSAFSRHALANENSVVKVPDGSDLVMLSPLGCGLQTGSGAVINVLKPEEGSSIIIFGAGAVGISAVFAAAYLKLSTIILVDIVQDRLDLALTLGATHVINSKKDDVLEKVKEITDGLMVDYCVEATGADPCIKAGWSALANTGKMCQCGTRGPGFGHNIDIFEAICTCKTYICMSEGDSNPPKFIPFLADLYAQGKFPIDKISKTYDYKKFDDAVHAMHDGSTIKPIVVFKQ